MAATAVELRPGIPRNVNWSSFAVSQSGSQAIAVAPQPPSASTSTSTTSHRNSAGSTAVPAYLCSTEATQLVEPIELTTQAFAVFVSLPELLPSDEDDEAATSEDEQERNRNRVCTVFKQAYIQAIRNAQKSTDEDKERQLAHLAASHSFFALLPAVLSSSLVGETLLDWLNTLDPQPATEDGVTLATLADPWTEPAYWDYIVKAVLRGHMSSAAVLLQRLEKHDDDTVASCAAALSQTLQAMPRSSQAEYKTEREYTNARRAWSQSVARLQRRIDHDWKDSDNSEIAFIQGGMSHVIAVLTGDQSRILESVDDLREAVSVWGVWINPSLRATNLPSIVQLVSKTLPTDSTDLEQVVTRAMLEQDWLKALQSVHPISPFLSAHLVALLPSDLLPTVETHEPLARYFYRTYADCLPASMWKAKVTYLERGRDLERARAILLGGTDSIEERISIASALDWEDAVRSLCLTSANECIERGEWGKALAYEVRAGNRPRIERFVRQVLTLYVTSGAEDFVNIVDSFPTSLLTPAQDEDEDMERDTSATTYSSLVFLARYRDFLALYARNERNEAASLLLALLRSGVGSKFGFEPVMLLDCMPLLEPGSGLIDREGCMELLRILENLVPAGTTTTTRKKSQNEHLELVALLVGSIEAAEKQFRILRARIAACLAQTSV